MTLALSSVATEKDLRDRIGGAVELDNIVSDAFSAKNALQLALADVTNNLKNRTPPVLDTDLVDPTELKTCVVLRAAALLYLSRVTTEDGVQAFKHRTYQRDYDAAMSSLRPTVGGGVKAASGFTITMHRR